MTKSTCKKCHHYSYFKGYVCECSCHAPTEKVKRKGTFKSGKDHPNYIHGLSDGKFQHTWSRILQRVNNPKTVCYDRYGGRGIKCLWRTLEEFRIEMYESYLQHIADHGERNTEIDRIDSDGHYCKENCRWVTRAENLRNRSVVILHPFHGRMVVVSEIAREFGIGKNTLRLRMSRGMTLEEALVAKPGRRPQMPQYERILKQLAEIRSKISNV